MLYDARVNLLFLLCCHRIFNMCIKTNTILEKFYISCYDANASTTKIMTCILALENCKLNEKVKFSSYAASIEPSKLYANAGEVFYLKDLLYSLMLPSHNDTAVAIAEHISGSSAKFVNLMNKKAAEIGCTNTHFATPNVLDAGYCFVGLSHSAKGITYISVVLGGSSSSERWQDSQRLLTYAYYH